MTLLAISARNFKVETESAIFCKRKAYKEYEERSKYSAKSFPEDVTGFWNPEVYKKGNGVAVCPAEEGLDKSRTYHSQYHLGAERRQGGWCCEVTYSRYALGMR